MLELWPGELDHGLDVLAAPLEQGRSILERDAARDEALKPRAVRSGERIGRELVVPARGIDRAEHDVVLEHHRGVQPAGVDGDFVPAGADAGETDDAGGGGGPDGVEHDLPTPVHSTTTSGRTPVSGSAST